VANRDGEMASPGSIAPQSTPLPERAGEAWRVAACATTRAARATQAVKFSGRRSIQPRGATRSRSAMDVAARRASSSARVLARMRSRYVPVVVESAATQATAFTGAPTWFVSAASSSSLARAAPLSIDSAASPSAAAPVAAQANPLFGTWITEKVIKDAPATVIVRPDSSASYGTETVRWRITGPKTILLALGGEWVSYEFKISGDKLTLSGGDLEKPITLTKLGPPTARPDSIPVPPDPDKS